MDLDQRVDSAQPPRRPGMRYPPDAVLFGEQPPRGRPSPMTFSGRPTWSW
jgi:hypothetical protein